VVTSVLQTTAGKMIFGRYIEAGLSSPVSPPVAEREREEHARARVRTAPQPQQT
jgi:hypothetical protein